MSKQTSNNGLLVGAIVGGIIGAATALLLAPKTGQELRTDLGKQVDTISQKTKDVASTIRTQTQDLASNLRTQAKSVASEVCATTDQVVNSMAPEEEDMEKLGKEMDVMPTNTELEEKGLAPDPAQ